MHILGEIRGPALSVGLSFLFLSSIRIIPFDNGPADNLSIKGGDSIHEDDALNPTGSFHNFRAIKVFEQHKTD